MGITTDLIYALNAANDELTCDLDIANKEIIKLTGTIQSLRTTQKIKNSQIVGLKVKLFWLNNRFRDVK